MPDGCPLPHGTADGPKTRDLQTRRWTRPPDRDRRDDQPPRDAVRRATPALLNGPDGRCGHDPGRARDEDARHQAAGCSLRRPVPDPYEGVPRPRFEGVPMPPGAHRRSAALPARPVDQHDHLPSGVRVWLPPCPGRGHPRADPQPDAPRGFPHPRSRLSCSRHCPRRRTPPCADQRLGPHPRQRGVRRSRDVRCPHARCHRPRRDRARHRRRRIRAPPARRSCRPHAGSGGPCLPPAPRVPSPAPTLWGQHRHGARLPDPQPLVDPPSPRDRRRRPDARCSPGGRRGGRPCPRAVLARHCLLRRKWSGNATRANHIVVDPRQRMSGDVLLSHTVPRAVPSALKGLASGFGMEPGVSLSPWSP